MCLGGSKRHYRQWVDRSWENDGENIRYSILFTIDAKIVLWRDTVINIVFESVLCLTCVNEI